MLKEQRNRMLLVKIFKKKYPEQYADIISLMDLKSVIDTDLSNIPIYYDRFCQSQQIDSLKRVSNKGDREKTKSRRIFTGVILTIFSPSVFNGSPIIINGLLRAIGKVLNISPPSVEEMIGFVLFTHKHDSEFREEIRFITTGITSGWQSAG